MLRVKGFEISLVILLQEAGLIGSLDSLKVLALTYGVNVGQMIVDNLNLSDSHAALINQTWQQVNDRKMSLVAAGQLIADQIKLERVADELISPKKCGYLLGELLIAAKLINHSDLLAAMISSELTAQQTGLCLVTRGLLSARTLRKALHIQHHLRAGLTDLTKAASILARTNAMPFPA